VGHEWQFHIRFAETNAFWWALNFTGSENVFRTFVDALEFVETHPFGSQRMSNSRLAIATIQAKHTSTNNGGSSRAPEARRTG